LFFFVQKIKMKKLLLLPLFFISFAFSSQIGFIQQLGTDIDGETAGDRSGRGVSMNATGNRVAIGATQNDGNGSSSGHVRIYEWDGTAWTQLGTDIDGETAGDYSGSSVSMNATGNRVAIGAPVNDGNAGHVRIYEWDGTAWTQLGTDIDGEAAYDNSGVSVSINSVGDRVAIGASWNDGNAGHVRIYEWNGTAWTQLGTDIDGEAADDNSGGSVSINSVGDRVAIGASWNDGNGSNSGHVRIYEWNGTAWTQLGTDIDGEAANDNSGGSVSINSVGDRVAIGAAQNDGNGSSSGHVRIYEWNGTAWIQLGSDIDGEDSSDLSGGFVSINSVGDRVAIGAIQNDGNGVNAGHVRIYEWDGTAWTQLGTDIDGEAASDRSGRVSMNAAGDRVAIGARNNSGNGGNSGHVRIYYLCTNTYSNETLTACDSVTWNGVTYDSSGTFTNTIPNHLGCDSIVTLDVDITGANLAFTVAPVSLIAPPFIFPFNNTTPNMGNFDFTWDFGDGTIIATNDTNITHEYQYNGVYTVKLIAEDMVNNCGVDTLEKVNLINCSGGPSLSIEEAFNNLVLYPNPARYVVNIDYGTEKDYSNHFVEIVNGIGQVVFTNMMNSSKTQISVSELGAKGLYFINIKDSNNKILVTKHLIVN
jgi:hypothetical protein